MDDSSRLSDIFWQGLEAFLSERKHIILADMNPDFMVRRLYLYDDAVAKKSGALNNCVGFIDGTVIGIARPGVSEVQNVP